MKKYNKKFNLVDSLGGTVIKAKALDYNPNTNTLVITGRKLLTVLTCREGQFALVSNLHTQDHNLNCSDCKCSPFDNNLIVTAESHKLLLWNLNSASDNKCYDVIEKSNVRVINKVSFSPHKKDMLISASQDSNIRYYDLNTKKCVFKLKYKTDHGVRDASFNPNSEHLLAANYDDGILALWDTRRTDVPVTTYGAHSEPAFCLAWHPDSFRIATGGRDRKIKVCEIIGNQELQCIYTVHAINNPVAKVSWRPKSVTGNELASISYVEDTFINYWNVTRPWSVPLMRSMEQSQVIADFCWLNNEELLSCSGNGVIMLHHVSNATHLSDCLNPISMSCDHMGHIRHTFNADINKVSRNLGARKESDGAMILEDSTQLTQPKWSFLSDKYMSASAKCTDNRSSSRLVSPLIKISGANSDLAFNTGTPLIDDKFFKRIDVVYDRMMEFKQFAYHYKYNKDTILELCKHNEKIAGKLNRKDIGALWRLCQCVLMESNKLMQGLIKLDGGDLKEELTAYSDHCQYDVAYSDSIKQSQRKSIPVTPKSIHSDFFENGVANNREFNNNLDGVISNNAIRDLELPLDVVSPSHEDFIPEMIKPTSKSKSRHESHIQHSFYDQLYPYKEFLTSIASTKSIRIKHNTIYLKWHDKGNSELLADSEEIIPKFHTKKIQAPTLNFTPSLTNLITYLAECGDIQHAIIFYLCLYKEIAKSIDKYLVWHWVSAYLDLLQRYKLDILAARLYKFIIALPVFSTLLNKMEEEKSEPMPCSLQEWVDSSSTVCHRCSSCKTGVPKSTPCAECGAYNKQLCAVCRTPVQGLCTWCRGCEHGGHKSHMLEWYRENQECPTGCGHICIITFQILKTDTRHLVK